MKQYDGHEHHGAVVIDSTVAFVQEYRSEQNIAALASLIPRVQLPLTGRSPSR